MKSLYYASLIIILVNAVSVISAGDDVDGMPSVPSHEPKFTPKVRVDPDEINMLVGRNINEPPVRVPFPNRQPRTQTELYLMWKRLVEFLLEVAWHCADNKQRYVTSYGFLSPLVKQQIEQSKQTLSDLQEIIKSMHENLVEESLDRMRYQWQLGQLAKDNMVITGISNEYSRRTTSQSARHQLPSDNLLRIAQSESNTLKQLLQPSESSSTGSSSSSTGSSNSKNVNQKILRSLSRIESAKKSLQRAHSKLKETYVSNQQYNVPGLSILDTEILVPPHVLAKHQLDEYKLDNEETERIQYEVDSVKNPRPVSEIQPEIAKHRKRLYDSRLPELEKKETIEMLNLLKSELESSQRQASQNYAQIQNRIRRLKW